ncbi:MULTISPECIES: site-specific integrase [Burkholderia]|uniref:site-specific integrase n=1 Tax=Burkholderia TaxID=32008 RepID=UPI000B7A36A7|nr:MULTISPECIES: site-specific integrase [Burkholderia]OXJ00354.1 hypothetical protein CFB41_14355 [Burkholderia sp. AU33803]PRD87504.1 site-specific integrase [Burkholderia contaminans]
MASISIKTSSVGTKFIYVQIRIKGARPLNQSFKIDEKEMKYAINKNKAYFEKRSDIAQWIKDHEARIRNDEPVLRKKVAGTLIIDVLQSFIVYNDNAPEKEKINDRDIKRCNQLVGDFEEEGVTIESLNPRLLRSYLEQKQEADLASNTIYLLYLALKKAMLWHSRKNDYPQHLFEEVKWSGSSNERTRRLQEGEYELLMNGFSKAFKTKKKNLELKRAIDFALETCMRAGEMLKFDFADVNFEKKMVHMRAGIVKNNSARTIPLTPLAYKILKDIFEEVGQDRKIKPFGKDWSSSQILGNKFRVLTDAIKLEDFHYHDLRHEAISKLYERNLNWTDIQIASVTGHKNLQMLKRYAHLRGELLVEDLWKNEVKEESKEEVK